MIEILLYIITSVLPDSSYIYCYSNIIASVLADSSPPAEYLLAVSDPIWRLWNSTQHYTLIVLSARNAYNYIYLEYSQIQCPRL